jgi:dTDP-4-amino-4,6-dideoxygalactose transaminase
VTLRTEWGVEKLAVDGGAPVFSTPYPSIRNAAGRTIGAEEMAAVADVMNSGCLAYIYGKYVGQFEADFARLIGVKTAVATSSGTAALHTALIYLNPEPGDEVIVSPLTDMGSVIPVVSQLAVPVFVDVDPFDQNIDPKAIEAAITPRTKAIIVTHLFGAPADMDAIMAIARKHDIFVIEDCAQAHLARYKGRTTGAIGDMACYSFQQSKHITTGDGGMVVTNQDGKFGRSLRLCMDKGWPRDRPGRDHLFLAPNYHMTELQAAVGVAQLRKLPEVVETRRRVAQLLDGEINQMPSVRLLGVRPNCEEVRWAYAFTLDLARLTVPGTKVVEALRAEGIDCFLGYPGQVPLYRYPMLKDRLTFGNSGWPFTLPGVVTQQDFGAALCPIAEAACLNTVVLWWTERITEADARRIGAAIRKVIGTYEA